MTYYSITWRQDVFSLYTRPPCNTFRIQEFKHICFQLSWEKGKGSSQIHLDLHKLGAMLVLLY